MQEMLEDPEKSGWYENVRRWADATFRRLPDARNILNKIPGFIGGDPLGLKAKCLILQYFSKTYKQDDFLKINGRVR